MSLSFSSIIINELNTTSPNPNWVIPTDGFIASAIGVGQLIIGWGLSATCSVYLIALFCLLLRLCDNSH
jgi:hypothetical protein